MHSQGSHECWVCACVCVLHFGHPKLGRSPEISLPSRLIRSKVDTALPAGPTFSKIPNRSAAFIAMSFCDRSKDYTGWGKQ